MHSQGMQQQPEISLTGFAAYTPHCGVKYGAGVNTREVA
jgi:hypothetical protein